MDPPKLDVTMMFRHAGIAARYQSRRIVDAGNRVAVQHRADITQGLVGGRPQLDAPVH
jgi:hypothetical protein